jgi:glycosyltransferase involved in cell wall biosynthesis
MTRRKTVCVLSFSWISKDARVLRHLRFFGERYDLIAIGYGDDPAPLLPGVTLRWCGIEPAWGNRFLKVLRTLLRWPGRIIPALDWLPDKIMADWRAARRWLEQLDYDLFLGNDVSALLLGIWQHRRKGKPFIMDYHEYAPLEAEEKLWHRWFHGPHGYRLLKRYGRLAAGSSTVNDVFAARFETEFGFKVVTVMNAPELVDLPPQDPRSDGSIHLAFHGHPGGARNLEALLGAMSLTDDRFVLHLMLMSGTEPGSAYRQLAAAAPPGRIIFEDTVSPGEIVPRLSAWDIGCSIPQALNYNHRHMLPIRMFDSIHAGLAVLCSDTVLVSELNARYGFGWVLPEVTPESIAAHLNALSTDDILEKKAAALLMRQKIHARTEEAGLVALADSALAGAS